MSRAKNSLVALVHSGPVQTSPRAKNSLGALLRRTSWAGPLAKDSLVTSRAIWQADVASERFARDISDHMASGCRERKIRSWHWFTVVLSRQVRERKIRSEHCSAEPHGQEPLAKNSLVTSRAIWRADVASGKFARGNSGHMTERMSRAKNSLLPKTTELRSTKRRAKDSTHQL